MPVFDVSALEALMPEPEEVRTAARSLLDSATAIDATTETAAQSWGKLQAQGVYVIDGSEVVFSAYRPIQRASGNLVDDFGTLDAAANVFADAVADLKARLADVKTRAAAFNKKIAGDDEWNKDKDLIGEQDGITNELSAIRSELSGHERDFAQAISDMYGGNEYVEFSGNGPGEGQFEHGVSTDVLNAGAAEGIVPWAHPRAFDKPWYRDAGDAYWAYTKAFYGAGLDTVLGLATLAGLGGKDAFVQSWTGVGTLAHDLFIVTGAGMPFMMATGQEQKVKDSAGNLLEIAKDTIHLDEWKTDPASALGATVFDVVTTVGTAGVGAGVKGASVAGKAGNLVDNAGDAGKAGKGDGAPSKGQMADLAESALANGARAADEIKVRINDIKKTVIEHAHDAVKETLGRLGIGHGVKDDAPQTKGPVEDAPNGGAARTAPYPETEQAGAHGAAEGGTGTRSSVPAALPENNRPGAASGPDTPPRHPAPEAPVGKGAAPALIPDAEGRPGPGMGAGDANADAPRKPGPEGRPGPGTGVGDVDTDAPRRPDAEGNPVPDTHAGRNDGEDSATRAETDDHVPENTRTNPAPADVPGEGTAPTGHLDANDSPAPNSGHPDDVRSSTTPTGDTDVPANNGPGSGSDDAGVRDSGSSSDHPARPAVTHDGQGRPETVEYTVGDQRVTHTVSTRNDQIAQLRRSLDPENWNDVDGLLRAHLSPEEYRSLNTLRNPDGTLPPKVAEAQVAELVEKVFGTQGRADAPDGLSPLEAALRGVQNRYYYDLSDAQAELVYDIRHMLGTGDHTQPFQKILSAEQADKMFDENNTYRHSAGGFISQASDTAGLRTVDEIILGLRLDYSTGKGDVAFRVGEVDEIYAVRFHADAKEAAELIQIPDASNRARVEELRRDRTAEADRWAAGNQTQRDIELRKKDGEQFDSDLKTDGSHDGGEPIPGDSAMWPNKGDGLTSSRVDHTPIVPELLVDGGLKLKNGSEMWRIDRNGNEVLVGIYSTDLKQWINL